MENLAGITPFVYCYADNLLEISLSSPLAKQVGMLELERFGLL